MILSRRHFLKTTIAGAAIAPMIGQSIAESKISMDQLIAHRGFGALGPENTMLAFRQATAIGAMVLETDVQISQDGIPVIIHDPTVNRTTNGVGAVSNLTYSQLSALDAGSKFKGELIAAKIPKLDEFMSFCRINNVVALPEVKGYRSPNDISLMLASMLANGMTERTIWSSFRLADLVRIRQTHGIRSCGIALIADNSSGITSLSDLGGNRIFMPEFTALMRNLNWIEECRQKKIKVWPWTIDSTSVAKQLLDAGCDKIVSNKPLAA